MSTSTRARVARSSLRAAGALLLLAPAGCSWWGQDRTCASAAAATAEVVTPADVLPVDESSANLVLDVSTSHAEPVRVTVTFDEVRALDVSAPGTPASCAHGPIHRYGYELPAGPLVVEVAAEGETGSAEVEVGDRTQWVVVAVQEGFPVQVEVWQEQPVYG